MGDDKRRLPLLQPEDPAEQQATSRPAWQWIGIGIAATFFAWLPLAYLAQMVARALAARRLGGSDPALAAEAYAGLDASERLSLQLEVMAAPAIALIVASAIGGMVLGRFDPRSGRRDATLAGALVAGLAALLALPAAVEGGVTLSWLVATVAVSGLSGLAARIGAAGGDRR